MEERKRDLALELLKALGFISVIVIHPVMWTFILNDQAGLRFPQAGPFFAGLRVSGFHFLPFLLPTVAGISICRYVLERRPGWGAIVLRSASLLILGYALNYLMWGIKSPADTFDWDFLPFFALSQILAYPFITRLPRLPALLGLLCLGGAALACSSSLPLAGCRSWALYPAVFGDPSGENYWPLCPWFSLIVAGVLTGYLQHAGRLSLKKAILFGTACLFAAAVSGHFFLRTYTPSNIWGGDVFKPSMFFVTGVIGFNILAFSLVRLLLDSHAGLRRGLESSPLLYFARGILWIYLLTMILGYHLTQLILTHIPLDFGGAMAVMTDVILLSLGLGYLVGKGVSGRKTVAYY